MPPKIDIKAIISHIVKGDGLNKCRICMGDTSTGQIYLGETVIISGAKSVTFATLLESAAGIRVSLEDEQPQTLCVACADATRAAVEFRLLCQQAESQWHAVLALLNSLSCNLSVKHRTLYAIVNEQETIIIKDYDKQQSIASVAKKVNGFSAKKDSRGRPKLRTTSQPTTKCPFCGKSYMSKRRLYVHLKESSDLKRACYICADIMMRDDLLIHLKKKHDQNACGCVKCPTICRSRKELIDHEKNEHSNSNYKCLDCQRSFHSRSKYLAHEPVHRQMSCVICHKTYYNLQCYLHHKTECVKTKEHKQSSKIDDKSITKSKYKEGTYICDYCARCFQFKYRIVAHIKSLHMRNTTPCEKCGKLVTKEMMNQHLKIHDPTCFYRCEYCGMALKTIEGYRQHIRKHTGEKPYKCKYCGKSFYSSSHYWKHVRWIHLKEERKKFPCKVCPSQLLSRTKLKRHMKLVHKYEVPAHLKLYKCPHCDESFTTIRGLFSHKRMKHLKALQEFEVETISTNGAKSEV